VDKNAILDVLVVDDDADFARFVKGVAESIGLRAEVLDTPSEFKTKFEALRPATVVLDIAMPGIDGVQLSQWMGQQFLQHGQQCRVILVSGYGVEFIRLCSSIAALSGLENIQGLSKPIEHGALAAALTGEGKDQP